jgi:hypothetical protein
VIADADADADAGATDDRPRVPNTMSHDELHNDVVTLAQRYAGFRLDGDEQSRLERYRHELYAAPRYGDGRVADPVAAGDLGYLARRALDQLNACAPPGRRFVLTDALYCVEDRGACGED